MEARRGGEAREGGREIGSTSVGWAGYVCAACLCHGTVYNRLYYNCFSQQL